MDKDIYKKLAAHLDRLPGGFPPSSTSAELRILQNLFTPQEAELAINLTLNREEAKAIATRTGLPIAEVEKRLEEMAQKGLILSIQQKDGSNLYQAFPFIVGIWEAQINNLNATLVKEMGEWQETRQARPLPIVTRQIRTIPIYESIPVHLEVLPYERAEELIKAENRFAVAPCICRKLAKEKGAGCNVPEESCLSFSDFADFNIRTGRARRIERSEVEQILKRADAFNLVLQPSYSQRAEFICCCCGDCCGVLRAAKSHLRPWQVVSSGFVASFESEECQGCQTCLERCQMQALIANGDKVLLKTDRCIGCGLCVSTCPSGALKLERRTDIEKSSIPVSMSDAWQLLSKL